MPSEVRFADLLRFVRKHGWTLIRVRGSHHVLGKPDGSPFQSRCIMAKSNRSTTAKLKKSSAKIDRSFDADLLKRARHIAEQYRIIVRQEDGEYYGQALELPGAMNDGKTPTACLENTIDMVTTTIATLLERGQIPPLPASDDRRDEQVNVRLSKLEKMTFEEAARSRGFRGLSDFMRAATMQSVSP